MCLLDIFSKLENKYRLKLAVAHINYGLRGEDSQRDEKFVRQLAKKYGLEIFVYATTTGTQFIASEKRARLIAPLRKNKKTPSENSLRDIRYDFFEKIRQQNNFDLIAVAHNMDDQVETFLMRIIRGAGLQGLSSIKYKNGTIIRPLLAVSRLEIEKYLKENRLKSRIDKTNLESKYSRNKIRNNLLPYLEKNFNPQIRKTIFNSVESIFEDYSLISEIVDDAFSKLKSLSAKDIKNLPPALGKRIILKALARKKQDLKDIESAHVREILKMITSNKSKKQIVKLKGLMIKRSGDKITIEKIK